MADPYRRRDPEEWSIVLLAGSGLDAQPLSLGYHFLASILYEEEGEMKKQVFVAVFLSVAVGAAALVLSLVGLGAQMPVSRAHSLSQDAAIASVNAFKLASAETARPGDLITYTIIMYNSDPKQEVDVLMVDVIPPHTRYVTHTIADRMPADGTIELPGTGVLPGTGTLPITGTLGFFSRRCRRNSRPSIAPILTSSRITA